MCDLRCWSVQVKAACEDTGFFCISGHQCNPGALKAVFEASRPFFNLPKSKKLQYVVSDMRAGRGYEVSSEHLDYEKWTQSRAAEDAQIASVLQARSSSGSFHTLRADAVFLCISTNHPRGEACVCEVTRAKHQGTALK